MVASPKSFLKRLAFAGVIAAMVPAFATAADVVSGQSVSPALQCRVVVGKIDLAWTVELDHDIPLAIVNNEDTPAQYTSGHVSIRLAASGPNLLIGLQSGRLLVTAPDGTALGSGLCKPLMTAATGAGVSLATLPVPETLFHPATA